MQIDSIEKDARCEIRRIENGYIVQYNGQDEDRNYLSLDYFYPSLKEAYIGIEEFYSKKVV